ncbi:hypothetical protein BGZ59_009654 [Podila verticillata]|nr:hypothetical protein BGZ59_009654 [Podila verticillata]
MTVTNSTWLDFVIGFVVSLIGSVMNAAGVNLLKLDHVRNNSHPLERQRKDCGRPMWHLGLYLYIGSQLAGSTIALNFLKTQWVAPLGSIALIFNFIFAKILVGTRIIKQDVWGTIVVMISVIWIVVFGGMNSSAADVEETLTLPELKALFSRPVFIIYFSIINIVIAMFLSLGLYAFWAITMDDESGQLRKNMKARLTRLLGTSRFARASGLTMESDEGLRAEARDLRMKKVVAMIMSACGGLLASETLLLAKSGVKLISSSVNGHNQFQDSLSYFILCILLLTAILQVYCLNTALRIYDSVLVVPVFYGFYTAFGLINSIIYLNQLQSYQPWVLLMILIGIGALIYGVHMLSAPKPDSTASEAAMAQFDNNDDENEITKSGSGGTLASESRVTREKKLSKDDEEEQGTTKPGEMHPFNRRGTGASSIATKVSPDAPGLIMIDENEGGHSRRSSTPQPVLKAMTCDEKWASLDGAFVEERRRSIPKIDTNVGSFTRGRSLTPKDSTVRNISGAYSRPMSPSEFRAQYTNSPFPVKPKHLQERENNSLPTSTVGFEGGCNSPRRITGNTKIDQFFEGLNPFKALRRGSLTDGSTGGLSNASLTACGGPRRASTSSLPTSPSRAHSTDRYGHRSRQVSFTGRPSEWEEPNRRVRHSMLFGENGRSSSVGSRSSRSASPAPSSGDSRHHSNAELGSAFGSSSGAWSSGPLKDTNAPGPLTGGNEENPITQPHQHKHLSGHGSHYRSVSSTHYPQHGRQLSFTTKNDKDVATEGGHGPRQKEDDSQAISSSVSMLPISVQQQLQQLQQHQHYPTSSLQHSLTTSSISTIGSMVPSMSTTSLAQFGGGIGHGEGGGNERTSL